MKKFWKGLALLIPFFLLWGGVFSCAGDGTFGLVNLTDVSITVDATEIAADGELTLYAQVKPLVTSGFSYTWSIVKVDGVTADSCDFVTLKNLTSTAATLKGTNSETKSHTVTVRLVVTDGTNTKEYEVTITVQAKKDTTVAALTDVTIAGSSELAASGETTYTASPVYTGEDFNTAQVTYAWSLEPETYAELTEETGTAVTLKGKNTLTTDQTVTLKVTATYGDTTKEQTKEITIKAVGSEPAAKLEGISLDAATYELDAKGTVSITATPVYSGTPTLTYTWTIEGETDYAKLPEVSVGEGLSSIALTGNSTDTEASHSVTIKVIVSDGTNTKQATATVTIKKASATPQPIALTKVTISGAEKIEAAVSTELTAAAEYTGDDYDATKVTYAWSIVKSDDTDAASSDYATVTPNATDSSKATVQATNTTTSEHTVTVKVVASYNGDSANKAEETKKITIAAAQEIVKNELTDLGLVAAKASADASDTIELTATASYMGEPKITYTWEIVSGGDYGTLELTSGGRAVVQTETKKNTLTVKNLTASTKEIVVRVTANDSTNTKTADATITVGASKVTKVALSGETSIATAIGTTELTATADKEGIPEIEYEWKITSGGDYATISGSGSKAVITGKNTTKDAQEVTVTVTAKNKNDVTNTQTETAKVTVAADAIKSISAVLADTAKLWTEGDSFTAADVKVTPTWVSGKTAELLASTEYSVSPTTLAATTDKIEVALNSDATIKTSVSISVKEKEKKAITSLTIDGSHTIACDAKTTLTATAATTGNPDLAYAWSIKENTTAASLSNSTTNIVELIADNQSTENTVTVTIIVTATDKTDATVTKTSEAFEITIEKRGVEVKDEVTALAVNIDRTEIGTIGTATLTASPTKTGNPAITYTWAITAGGDYATLSATTGESVTLTGKNTTKTAQTVKVTLTAKYTVDDEEKTVSALTPTEITVAAKTLERIAIASQPTKKDYFVGDTFDSTGLKVNAFYSDATETAVDVTSKVTLSGNTTTTSAESQTVTVTYADDFGTKTAEFTITVAENSITGITAELADATKNWIEGNAFSASDVSVTPTWKSGKAGTKLASTEYTVSPTTLTKDTNAITVTYKTFTQTVAITVAAKSVTKIEVTAKPTKLTYQYGETFSSDGLKVTATYNNGTTAELASTAYTVSAPTMTKLGEQAVTVTYGDTIKDTFIITISDYITGITAQLADATKKWTDGDTFTASDVTVKAVYASGKDPVTQAAGTYTVSPTALTKDTKKITVTHTATNKTAEIAITVAAKTYPSDISVTVPVTDIDLEAVANGAKLTVPAGITATAITWYVNGTQAKAETMLTSGTYTFTLGTDATATAGTQYTIKAVVTTANVDYTRSVAVEYSNE